MLIKRIIPCLDVHGGRVVKGINFANLKDAGDPVKVAAAYDKAGADEIVLLDITATAEGRKTIINLVSKVAKNISIPFTVGGGIVSLDDFRDILTAGADKVSINSSAVKNPNLITEAARAFGKKRIVVAVDAKRRQDGTGFDVYISGGRENTGLDVLDWVKKAEELGAGEILLTSMDCDGTKNGYDIPLTRAVAEAVQIPVIASGGAGKPEHFYEALTEGGAGGALAASLFHYREVEIGELKKFLSDRGVIVGK